MSNNINIAKFLYLTLNIQTNEVRRLGVGLRGVVTSFAISMKAIPLIIEQKPCKKPMMIVVEYGHKQMFYFDLGGVARILNLGNDFGSLHRIAHCTTGMPTMYLGMMSILIWSRVVRTMTTNTLGT
jgi:hypothetical protein